LPQLDACAPSNFAVAEHAGVGGLAGDVGDTRPARSVMTPQDFR
jgi:hypothetical protein